MHSANIENYRVIVRLITSLSVHSKVVGMVAVSDKPQRFNTQSVLHIIFAAIIIRHN